MQARRDWLGSHLRGDLAGNVKQEQSRKGRLTHEPCWRYLDSDVLESAHLAMDCGALIQSSECAGAECGGSTNDSGAWH